MGAATFTKTASTPIGVIDNKRAAKGTITMSASYASGGDTLDLKTVGLTEVTNIYIDATNTLVNSSGLSCTLSGTKSAPLIICWETNATEVANGTNLSARNPFPVILLGA